MDQSGCRPTAYLVTRLGPGAGEPARRLRDAAEPLAMHATGSPAVRAELAELGLDRFPAYVWSRAACLGEAVPAVVSSAFAVFEPRGLHETYLGARATCPRARLLAVREAATVRSLLAVLGTEPVEDVVVALRRGLAAGSPAGRPLFAGLAALPWPRHPLGQLWRACELLREHRGDGHVMAWVGHGLDPVEVNVLTELWLAMGSPAEVGRYPATRGWGPADIAAAVDRLQVRGLVRDGALTERGRTLRGQVEDATNRGEHRVLAALGADLEPLVAALAQWSARCIEAGTFTADEAKRAAG